MSEKRPDTRLNRFQKAFIERTIGAKDALQAAAQTAKRKADEVVVRKIEAKKTAILLDLAENAEFTFTFYLVLCLVVILYASYNLIMKDTYNEYQMVLLGVNYFLFITLIIFSVLSIIYAPYSDPQKTFAVEVVESANKFAVFTETKDGSSVWSLSKLAFGLIIFLIMLVIITTSYKKIIGDFRLKYDIFERCEDIFIGVYEDLNKNIIEKGLDSVGKDDDTHYIKCEDIDFYEDCSKGPATNRCERHHNESSCTNDKFLTSSGEEENICIYNSTNSTCSPNDIIERECIYEVSQDDVCAPISNDKDIWHVDLENGIKMCPNQTNLSDFQNRNDSRDILSMINSGNFHRRKDDTLLSIRQDLSLDDITGLCITQKNQNELKDSSGNEYTNPEGNKKLIQFNIDGETSPKYLEIDSENGGSCDVLVPKMNENNELICAHTDNQKNINNPKLGINCGIKLDENAEDQRNRCYERYIGMKETSDKNAFEIKASQLCNLSKITRDTTEMIDGELQELEECPPTKETILDLREYTDGFDKDLKGCLDMAILEDQKITYRQGNFPQDLEDGSNQKHIQSVLIEQIKRDYQNGIPFYTVGILGDSELLKNETGNYDNDFTGNFYELASTAASGGEYYFPILKETQIKNSLFTGNVDVGGRVIFNKEEIQLAGLTEINREGSDTSNPDLTLGLTTGLDTSGNVNVDTSLGLSDEAAAAAAAAAEAAAGSGTTTPAATCAEVIFGTDTTVNETACNAAAGGNGACIYTAPRPDETPPIAESCVENQGNPDCWSEGTEYTYDNCCNGSPDGNPDCWDGTTYTYQICC